MNNLEWLMEHDTDAVRDALRCFVDGETVGCSECAYDKHRVDGVCMNSSEWLMSEHETNGIGGETNGITDEITLHEGDAVKLMREHSLYEIGVMLHPAGGGGCTLSELADMVERDYVRRDDYDFMADALKYMKAERDELTDKIGEITDEVSELMKKQPYTFNVHDVSGSLRTVGRYIDELTAERDEWKAKAEQANDDFTLENDVRTGDVDANDRNAPLEPAPLLRDYDEFLSESCNQVADQREHTETPLSSKWQANDAQKVIPNAEKYKSESNSEGVSHTEDSREKLEADALSFANGFIRKHNGAISWNDELYRGIVELLDRQAAITTNQLTSKSDVSKPEETAENATTKCDIRDFGDSREKLEADVRKNYSYTVTTLMYPPSANKSTDMLKALPVDTVIGWLNRQASITSKEWCWTNDSLQEQVNMLTDQRDRWHSNWTERNTEYDELLDEYDELKAERDELRRKLEVAVRHEFELDQVCDECEEHTDELLAELTAERDYWKQEVALCMQSAYPPSHSPERAYDPDVMAYPDRHGCTTPSTLVSALIDGLRDERTAECMGLLDEIVKLKEERDGLQDLLRALERELKIARGDLNLTLNNWEQAKGKILRQTEELAERRRKLDERDQKTVEEIRDDRADYWKSRAEKSEKEREEWRSKCGKLMGLANEMMSA